MALNSYTYIFKTSFQHERKQQILNDFNCEPKQHMLQITALSSCCSRQTYQLYEAQRYEQVKLKYPSSSTSLPHDARWERQAISARELIQIRSAKQIICCASLQSFCILLGRRCSSIGDLFRSLCLSVCLPHCV